MTFLGKTDVTKTHLGLLSEVVGFAFSLDFGLSIILRKVSVLYIVDLMNWSVNAMIKTKSEIFLYLC